MPATDSTPWSYPVERTRQPSGGETSARAFVAREFTSMGRGVLYLATSAASERAQKDPDFGRFVPEDRRWTLRPLALTAQSARRGLAGLIKEGMDIRPILGTMCLPSDVLAILFRRSSRGHYALIVEGVQSEKDPETTAAIEALENVANRTVTAFALIL